MLITVQRQKRTSDGIFGVLTLDFNPFVCFTVENLLDEMLAGIYDVTFDYSPAFNRAMPHIWDPARDAAAKARGQENAGLRIHWANFPKQLRGCIAVGDKEEPDAIDDSVTTFNQLYKLIKPITGLKIQIIDIPVTL